MFDKNIKFKYSWRPYQAKVLEQAGRYLKDKRINIVAAPGSGKTVLGLELARRLGQAVLILSPTVTIKNQWIDRFVSLFMRDDSIKPVWISDNVYDLKYFTSITYQGLHCAYKRTKLINRKNMDETDDEVEIEHTRTNVDIKQYDIIQEIKDKKIKTIVLDEAHHLKSEWWQSLTNIIESLEDVTIVSLTATPPYDIEYNEWKRYIKLCGNIDMEISVPELVAAKNLCPHQDYIYFNYPTEEEKQKIKKHIENVKLVIKDIKRNKGFVDMLKNHPFIINTHLNIEQILDNVELYSSMLIFLNEVEPRSIDKEKVKILGHNSAIPNLTSKWMELLLEKILFEDDEYFNKHVEIIESIKRKLNSVGAIEKKKVYLTNNSKLNKYFVNSISKLESINRIVESEYNSLKQELRMVILTDFLRKEYIFEDNIEIKKIGVFPIFLNILQKNININMAILTGSIFMIPVSMQSELNNELNKKGIVEKEIEFAVVDKVNTYCIVQTSKKYRSEVMKCISSLFSQGKINLIIGTKSLLGEGWDEPSINSLVLASFVGSYVLSNQMRGRAIRINDNPKKTANIWHLVSVLEQEDIYNVIENSDFEMIKKRFKAFVGIGYNEDTIENGVERLDIIPTEFTKNNLDEYNKQLVQISSNRLGMYNRWFELLDLYGGKSIQVTNQIETKKENMRNSFYLIDPKRVLLALLTFCFSQFVMSLDGAQFYNLKTLFITSIIAFVITFLLNFKLFVRCVRGIMFAFPKNQFKAVTDVVIQSLIETKNIYTPYQKIKINVKENKYTGTLNLQLKGLTTQENNMVLESLKEIFSCINDQRYILINRKRRITTYYCVPEIFAINKQKAQILHKNWEKYIGTAEIIYTRSISGRKVLIEARKQTFNYTNEIKFVDTKKPLSKWQ